MTTSPQPERVVSSILRYDRKQNSCTIALLRAVTDAVVSYPDTFIHERDVAIPLRILARFWVAYYCRSSTFGLTREAVEPVERQRRDERGGFDVHVRMLWTA